MSHSDSEQKNSNLSARQRKALTLLGAAASISEAARLSKVDRRTLHRWLQDEDFRAGLAQFHQQATELASVQLQGIALHAVRALAELLESPNPDIRLRAIRTALSCSTKLNELRKLGDDVQALSDALYINNH